MNPEYFIELWAPAVANHLWQSTLFAAVVALLALTLRNYQARTRYWLWLAASAKFLIPFSLLLSVGSHLAWSFHSQVAQPVLYSAIDQLSQPFSETTLPNASIIPATSHTSTILPAFLTVLWLCGFIAVLAFWSIQLRRVSKSVREAKPRQSGREIEILRRLEQTANLRNPIQLLSSPHSMEPGVFGILHPVLLWPEGISQHLDDAHLEAILAHEVCHVQRRDNLTSAIHMLVAAIFWFHPLVWWLEKRLIDERERACDEAVLQLGKQPQVYAESILKVCEFCIESPLSCISGITGADLKKRIVQIMTNPIVRKLDHSKKLLLGAVGLTTICVPIVFGQIIATQHVALQTPASLKSFDIPSAFVMEGTSGDAGSSIENTAGKIPAFEVVSVRQNKSGSPDNRIEFTPDGITIRNASLQAIIVVAYHLRDPDLIAETRLIPGAPSWIRSDQYDIQARIAGSDIAELKKLPGDQQSEQKRLMLRSLLADRFNLKFHRETKEAPGYALVIAKTGPKLKRLPDDSTTIYTHSDRTHIAYHAASLNDLAARLTSLTGRPVLDKTGLAGKYDFTMSWAPDQNQGEILGPGSAQQESTSPLDSSGPSIFTALQEQLGLKLESAKGLVEGLVIDHIEPPSEN